MKRRSFLLPLLICAASCSSPPPPQRPPAMVVMTQPEQRNIFIRLNYIGHVEANATVDVKAQVTGILTGKYYIDGQEVKQGDVLFTIDSRPYRADLERTQATFSQTQANLKFAQEKAMRYSYLIQDDFVSKLDYDQYVTNVATEQAALQQNTADVERAQLNVEYCTIAAPMDAVTGKTFLNTGNYIEIGGTAPLVTLNQIKPIVTSFYIPEKDLPRVQCLQQESPLKVRVYLNGDFEHPHEGLLTLIDNQVDLSTGTILLRATFPNDDKALWPGQFVDVDLLLGCKENALLLPSQAVKVGQEGPYVFVIKEDNTVEMRSVTTGQIEKDDAIVIESGLSPKENVVLEGQLNLFPGAPITIKNKGK